ncbi:MAG: hypothetical protein AAGF23_08960 [Acidobacteriota bacterium]
MTKRFGEALDPYNLRSTRIRPGEGHENGVAERGNDVNHSLLLRGNQDFDCLEEYQTFVDKTLERRLNRRESEHVAGFSAAGYTSHLDTKSRRRALVSVPSSSIRSAGLEAGPSLTSSSLHPTNGVLYSEDNDLRHG